ncbi:hypothetical protein [Sphaerisporangium corydalis]|uniref:ABC transporter permease n=1 Tax=Sphaerisporangium corydalis TaxID=1441875 RepID=A0ABV9ELW3_9ACTN|nr:hypothetical protein [Sphaerisporangium corydalis]
MSESIRIPSAWSLPLHTLRLAGRCLLPLVMWYSAGQLVRFGLLAGGTDLSHGSMRDLRLTLTMLIFVIMVMASMVVSVGMFHTLRGSLSEIRARRADGEEDEGFVGGLSRVIVPFVALYLAWRWDLDDVRAFLTTDIKRQSGEKGYLGAFADLTTGQPTDTAMGLTSLSFNITLIIMIAAFLGRYVFMLLHEKRGNRPAAIALAFCELAFVYYGLQVIASRGAWIGSRSIVNWWNDVVAGMERIIPGWEAFWATIGAIRPFAWDALVLPAAWLTVAILMYGAYAEDATTVIKGTRLETTAEQATRAINRRTHSLTRQLLTAFFGRWAHWVALANTMRLVVRAGAPLFGMFALCFAGIKVGEGYAARGLEYLAGNDYPVLYWDVVFVPINFAVDLAVTVLTTCLLAATFDVAAGAERRRRALASAAQAAGPEGPRQALGEPRYGAAPAGAGHEAGGPAVSGRTAERRPTAAFPGTGSATASARPGPPSPWAPG